MGRRNESIPSSSFRIPHGAYSTWTPLVISDGKMYLREQDNLYCYDVKAK